MMRWSSDSHVSIIIELSPNSDSEGSLLILKPLSHLNQRQAGQAVVEYILVMLIIIAVIAGVIYQFNDSFRIYAKNYFGDYLACLLETGELPSLGAADGSQGVCGALFQKFDPASGKPLTLAGGPGGSSGTGSSGGSSQSSQSSRGTSDTTDSSKTRASSSGGAASGSSGSGRRSSGGSGGGGGIGGDGDWGQGEKSRQLYTGSQESSIPSAALTGRGQGSGGRSQFLDGDFYVDRRPAPPDASENKIAVKRKGEGSTKSLDRMKVVRKPASADAVIGDDEPWSFGTYLRFLIIAAIVVALVLLIGGQAMQITRGMDS